ncbi:MAG: hypothetical protein IPN56_08475 [Chitinophagaceae bacterium]|nr:hypothetical protein [Chitinophagaceae bacterium]
MDPTATLIADLKGHSSIGSTQLILAPMEKKIVTVSDDKTAKVWDINSGNILADLKGHTKAVLFAKFSSDGKNCWQLHQR